MHDFYKQFVIDEGRETLFQQVLLATVGVILALGLIGIIAGFRQTDWIKACAGAALIGSTIWLVNVCIEIELAHRFPTIPKGR